ncbi:unnamed protein product [Sphagnum balticum]
MALPVKKKIRSKSTGKVKFVETIIGQDDAEVTLKYFSEKQAIDVVKNTWNRDILQRWLDEEMRHKGDGAGGGSVTQEQVGDLSRSFQAVAEVGSGDSWLATTRYGVDFIALRNETIIGFMPTGPIGPGCGPFGPLGGCGPC